MGYLRSTRSVLRKTILIGWAVAVVWIYLGNLINFHQHHIWGKQLIPVACSSTRYKEEDTTSVVKNHNNSKNFDSGIHFDFSSPDVQVSEILYSQIVSSQFITSVTPVLYQEFQAFSLRGPPSV